MTSPSDLKQWRNCGAPGCGRRIKAFYFCCGQHRALLGFELSSELQTRWRERQWNHDAFEACKARAMRVWGWEPETLMVKKADSKTQESGREDLARRAIKWLMEHRAYYDQAKRTMMQAASTGNVRVLASPPEDIAMLLFEMSREVELQAEHAS